jgi:tetratricopeptide (TPR) repeat protein
MRHEYRQPQEECADHNDERPGLSGLFTPCPLQNLKPATVAGHLGSLGEGVSVLEIRTLRENAMKPSLALCALFLTLTWTSLPSRAETNDQTVCENDSGDADNDTVITACTAVLNSSETIPWDRGKAYLSRGLAYKQKGQRDQAIEDFHAALAINPNNTAAQMFLDELGSN